MTVMRARNLGFTATETMVVVLILGIIAAFAAPAMNQLIRTQKVRAAAYDIFADLTYARSEAIARGHNVQVASSSGTNWVSGWQISDTTSKETLRVQGARSTGLAFTADAASLTFDRTGRTQNVSFQIGPTDSGAPNSEKRCIRIQLSGRPNTSTGVCS